MIKSLDLSLPMPILQFVGSCQNEAEERRLQKLKDRAIELKVDDHVEFYKNVARKYGPSETPISW